MNDRGRANDAAFMGIVATASPEIGEIAVAVRNLVYEILPQTVEVVWPRQGSVGWGTGPRKFTEQFAYAMCFKRHVTLGFYHGGGLPDPDDLLPRSDNTQVSGRLSMRSLKLSSVADVERPALRALIEESTRHEVPPPQPPA